MKFPPIIILIGSMGAGKTSTGKDLAKALRLDFLDTDHWIEEKNKKKIYQIFQENGEDFFRSQEKEAILWIREHRRIIVSTGGGLWMDENNRTQLLSLGWCIWLKVSAVEAWKRVSPHLSQRPMLGKEKNPMNVLKQLLEKRNPIYQLAHTSFLTDGKTSKEVAKEILEVLKKDSLIDLA